MPLEEGEDFFTLRNLLIKRFSPAERVTFYRCELRSRKRGKGETVREFGFALSRLEQDSKEITLVEQFIGGLSNTELQKHVQFGHPETLDRAISLAGEYVAFQGAPLERFGSQKTLSGASQYAR